MRRILCLLGRHDLEELVVKRCKVHKLDVLCSLVWGWVDALAKICKCKQCGKKIGVLTDGETSTRYSYDYMIVAGFFNSH
jgi:hypothetical protein